MKLITKSLTVMTLTSEQMKLYAENIHDLEKDLTLRYNAEPMEKDFRELVKKQAVLTAEDEANDIWHAFWMFNLDRDLIGNAYFKDVPDSWGRVEIAYSINEGYRNRGYTTEAVNKITNWAIKRGGVKTVTAEAEKTNIAAIRVLEKSGFEKFKETENYLYFKKEQIKEEEPWMSRLTTGLLGQKR